MLLCLSMTLFAVEQKLEGVGWLDVFTYNEGSKQKRVLLIGDSIVRQYAESVRNGVKDKYVVTRLSTSKSICSSQYLEQLAIAMQEPYEIILINNGLHDFGATNEEYYECFKKSLNYLMRKNPTSTIVLVSTTGVNGIKSRNDIVIERNISLKKLSRLYGISFVDLYSVVNGKLLWRDACHFNRGG